jgi:hypothetical protein
VSDGPTGGTGSGGSDSVSGGNNQGQTGPGGNLNGGSPNGNGGTSGNISGSAPAPGGSAPPVAGVARDPATVGSIVPRDNGGGRAAGLPSTLSPSDGASSTYLAPDLAGRRTIEPVRRALAFVPGTPVEIVWACREAIAAAARPHGAIQVDASSVGIMRRDGNGNIGAPLEVRVIYDRQGGPEIKQARIDCRLDSRRRVTDLR